jgi:hypothetical protein
MFSPLSIAFFRPLGAILTSQCAFPIRRFSVPALRGKPACAKYPKVHLSLDRMAAASSSSHFGPGLTVFFFLSCCGRCLPRKMRPCGPGTQLCMTCPSRGLIRELNRSTRFSPSPCTSSLLALYSYWAPHSCVRRLDYPQQALRRTPNGPPGSFLPFPVLRLLPAAASGPLKLSIQRLARLYLSHSHLIDH